MFLTFLISANKALFLQTLDNKFFISVVIQPCWRAGRMARNNQGYTPYYNNNDFHSPNHNYDEDFINVSQVSHAPSFRRPQLSKQDKEATENFKTQKKLETKKWNVFEETGDNDKSVSERKYDRSLLKKYKILKVNHAFMHNVYLPIFQFQVFTMFIIFCLTLTAGVVAKGATFFMVSQIGKHVIQRACPENFGYFSFNIRGEITAVELTETEKVGWIWAIFFCFLAGEFYTLVRCTRTILMKSYR